MDNLPLKVVEMAKSQLGSPYVFGAWGALCTPKEREYRYRLRPGHPKTLSECQVLRSSNPKSSCNGCKWDGDRCFDCRGFTHWVLDQVGIKIEGQGATMQYADKSNWLERGDIADMPECVCCVFVADGNKKSHTGLYVTGNHTIECSGEVKEKELSSRWTHYAIPKGLYTEEEIQTIRRENKRPNRILRKGNSGSDVQNLQDLLNGLGYKCGTADGIFGSKTQAAVKAFQQDNGLVPDGVVGMDTWSKLLDDVGNYPIPLYTAIIEGLTGSQVSELKEKYPNMMISEG